jgi:hypothetical protein
MYLSTICDNSLYRRKMNVGGRKAKIKTETIKKATYKGTWPEH